MAPVAEWRIAPIEPPEPSLSQLKARYEDAAAWEANARTGLDNYRITYVRALLAGEPGNSAVLRARERGWRKRLRDLQRAEKALTGLLLRANPVPEDERLSQSASDVHSAWRARDARTILHEAREDSP